MKTIFNTYVEVTSQEQANRLKQVCIDNGLQIWDSGVAFNLSNMFKWFCCNLKSEFFIRNLYFIEQEHKITESEWIELLEQHNKSKCMYTLTQEQVNELAKGKSIQEVLPEAFNESKSDILNKLIDYATTNDNIWLKNQLEKLR